MSIDGDDGNGSAFPLIGVGNCTQPGAAIRVGAYMPETYVALLNIRGGEIAYELHIDEEKRRPAR